MDTSKDESPLRLITDLGDGMKLYMAKLDSLREQDVNARILPSSEHNTLTNNIRNRGRLESVPYCALVEGDIEIVSGHHRIRSAREAGLSEAPILVDESGLSRSEIVAKQLAHNRLAGFDDPEVLRRLFESLEEPALILETGLASEMLNLPQVDLETGITPHLEMDWKVVTLTFLPHQLADFQMLIDSMPPSNIVGVATKDSFQPFMDALLRYARFKEVRNMGTALALLARIANEEVDKGEAEQPEPEALSNA